MSLLTAAKAKKQVHTLCSFSSLLRSHSLLPQDMGYAPDFVQSLAPMLGQVKKSGLKIISNAGGINPSSCVDALQAAAKQAGVELSVAMVTGDDLLGKVSYACISSKLSIARKSKMKLELTAHYPAR